MAGEPAALAGSALEDSDDDFQYEEVEVMSDDDDKGSEDLDATLRQLQALTAKQTHGASGTGARAPVPGAITRKPEVMDDFLRNFFVKMGLSRTCEAFEAEWYELKATGRLDANSLVPDVYLRTAELEDEVAGLRKELSDARSIASKASATWDKFRKERDFHRMHHKRVAQEKNKLINDIKRLKEHFAKYEPTILELRKKYETAMKEKMLASLERDKAVSKLDPGNTQNGSNGSTSTSRRPPATTTRSPNATANQSLPHGNGFHAAANGTSATAATATGSIKRGPQPAAAAGPTGWPSVMAAPRRNPYEDAELPPMQTKGLSLQKTFKGHQLSVANVALHPTKPILVTASDDKTWKMWHLPAGDLIMCGEGHKDWVAGVDFHPSGTALVSGSGDSTVKVWDFEKQRCMLTLTDHKQAVWAVKYHHAGEVVASASLDHMVRLWDLPAGRCKNTLRGHVDSVNDVCWQPFSSNLATASSDKTVSVWDARTGLCVQTLYGHANSCNAVSFNMRGSMLASSDADGSVKLWDTRMVAEILTIDAGNRPANKVSIDRSGLVLAVASDDGRVKMYSTHDGELLSELSGHEDAVQAVALDPNGAFVVSCGSDNTFRLWS